MGKESAFREGELALMLCTRLCHDMAGPISSVSNGLEFYHEVAQDAEMQQQAMDLIEMSSKSGESRLQLNRIAFGRADVTAESDLKEFKNIVTRYFSQGKILVEWDGQHHESTGWINSEMRRLVASMILLVAQVMVYGGKMTIFLLNNNRDVIVRGSNDKIKDDRELASIINRGASMSPEVELSPYNVNAWMLLFVAERMGLTLSFTTRNGDAGVEVELKGSFI